MLWSETNLANRLMTMKSEYKRLGENGNNYELFSSVHLAIVGLSLPVIGFFGSVAIALIYHFEESTATHCRVRTHTDTRVVVKLVCF